MTLGHVVDAVAELAGLADAGAPPHRLTGTLTVCREAAFDAPEVELAMVFAEVAGLVLSHVPIPDRDVQPPEQPDAVGRLLAVGLALQIVVRRIDDDRLRHVVERAIEQLDEAVVQVRAAGERR